MSKLDNLLRDRPGYSLEELEEEANGILATMLLADPKDARVKPEVSQRLIRHYVSEGTIDPAIRAGKNALYTVDHLLQLLALRRLLAEGFSSNAIGSTLRQRDRDELRAIAAGRSTLTADAPNAADVEARRARARATIDAIRRRTAAASGEVGIEDMPVAVASPRATPAVAEEGVLRPPATPGRGAHTVHAWDRVLLLDGVELHVRRDLRLPASIEARQRLLDHVIRTIVLYAQARDP